MFEMPDYTNPISLIPGGCPQILDYEAPISSLDGLKYTFAEIAEKGSPRLHAYSKNGNGDFVDEMDGSPNVSGATWQLNGADAIKPWLNQWTPLPFLRIRQQVWPDDGSHRFENGPTNWARGRLVTDENDPQILRLTLAFDMQVEEKQPDVYVALTPDDVDANAHFSLAWRFRDNAWFMDLAWVDQWLREIWTAWQIRKKRRPREDDPAFPHLAGYLAYLAALQRISRQCAVYVVRPDGRNCVNVDLVLDIGNSRTTGILVETRAQSATRLNDSYLLQLRDMSAPERVYTDPFETRVEFSEVIFGNDALSMRSGRATPAFVWPSPVRIGPEAARLATASRCEKGSTGMSSPKRYLWDERDWQRTWRFNTQSENAPFVTRGPLAQRVNASGTPLCCMEDRQFLQNRILRRQERESAFESLFTRSSLMMFLLVEIIQQALLTINSPGQRLRRDLRDNPRRLRQIIFTVPPGMPVAEQTIYRRWAQWAIHVLWEALGWGEWYAGNDTLAAASVDCDYRTSPIVRCDWDEATCTQLVFIYNEVTRKFQGDAWLFCQMTGRDRDFPPDRRAPSVRVAALDIGGGTTDLSITTFELASPAGATPRLAPHPDFHDGFNIGGDDALRAVVEQHVIPAIGEALEKAGLAGVREALATLFGRDTMDARKDKTSQRIQFARQIAAPVALCLLAFYEQADRRKGGGKVTFTFGDCFMAQPREEDSNMPADTQESSLRMPLPPFPTPSPGALAYVRDYVSARGHADDFNILAVPIAMYPDRIDDTVRGALGPALANLCEVINIYGCDALLLTGRPSRWPAVTETISSLLPLPPGRIFPMAEYNVGSWYPFSDAMGNIPDPKTTVVVGAILCALAEGQLEGFSFAPHGLKLVSTARHIGEMELTGQIRKEKVWFNVDPEKNRVEPLEREVIFSGPMAVGFRQLDVERWTTTRYYFLDWASPQALEKNSRNLPLKVKLKFVLPDSDDEEHDEGEFEIEDITGSDGDSLPVDTLEMRLQTLPRDEGFWMDTGIVYDF